MPRLRSTSGVTVNVSDESAAQLIKAGWQPVNPPPVVVPEPDETWTLVRLRAYATEHDIDLGGATRKADILNKIQDATTLPIPSTGVH